MATMLERLIATGRTGLFIGGEWLPASDGATIDVVDPATEEHLADVASGSPDDGVRAVEAAAVAAPAWAETAPRRRSEVLRRAFELVIERQGEFAELITRENGKALADAVGEVRYAAEFLRWFAEEAVRVRGETYRSPAGDKRVTVVYQPVGVSVLVTPWNFPIAMGTRKIGPALAAGCTVVMKPASDTPLASLALAFGPCLLRLAGVAGVRHPLSFWRRRHRHDLVAARSSGTQDPVVGQHVRSRRRDQGGEPR